MSNIGKNLVFVVALFCSKVIHSTRFLIMICLYLYLSQINYFSLVVNLHFHRIVLYNVVMRPKILLVLHVVDQLLTQTPMRLLEVYRTYQVYQYVIVELQLSVI